MSTEDKLECDSRTLCFRVYGTKLPKPQVFPWHWLLLIQQNCLWWSNCWTWFGFLDDEMWIIGSLFWVVHWQVCSGRIDAHSILALVRGARGSWGKRLGFRGRRILFPVQKAAPRCWAIGRDQKPSRNHWPTHPVPTNDVYRYPSLCATNLLFFGFNKPIERLRHVLNCLQYHAGPFGVENVIIRLKTRRGKHIAEHYSSL